MPGPDETGRHVLIPRTTEGAHSRIDLLRDDHGKLTKEVSGMRELLGDEPLPLQKKAGSGLLLTLSEIEVTHRARQKLDERALANEEKWRTRWTILAAIATTLLGLGTVLEKIAAHFFK